MVTKGGNNPLQYLIGADEKGQPQIRADAVQQSLGAWRDQILSKLYVGWVQGFCDAERTALQQALEKFNEGKSAPDAIEFEFGHPRAVLEQVATDLRNSNNAGWLQ
jgi:CRISPR-associated protein Cst2